MSKKIIISILIGSIIVFAIYISVFVINNEGKRIEQIIKHSHVTTSQNKNTKPQKQVMNKEMISDKYNLYISDSNLPFLTLFEISKFLPKEKESVDQIVSMYQNSYVAYLNKNTKKFLIIMPLQLNNRNIFDRHNIEIVEVSLTDKNAHNLITVFSGLDGETANSVEGFISENEAWEFDRTTDIIKPLKHIVHNSDDNVEYEETWNYAENEPVKYEMKDGEGHTISILKENFTNNSSYDKEHIFYNKDGQTELIVSIHYEGINITRLTYYNINDKENSFTIISEYTDGVKTSEKLYNTDYKLISDIKAEYKDGQISALEQNNGSEKEVIRK